MLQELANIGSFAGGTGVLLSVIYLAVQTKLSVRSTRGATYQAVVGAISDWTRDVGLNAEVTRIMFAGLQDPETLAPSESLQFGLLLTSVVRNFENIHYQHSTAAISSDTWSGWSARIYWMMKSPGAMVWWQQNKQYYSSAFGSFLADAPQLK